MRTGNKFLRSALSILLAVMLTAGAFPVLAAATEGKCGPRAQWSYDSTTGTLTVSGEGPMYDYANFSDSVDSAPYSSYRGKIKYLLIEEGITKIGSYAFSGLTNLVDVQFPEGSLTEIRAYAFNYCITLPRIMVPDSVTEIGEYAFTTCQKMVMIRFGNGITSLPEGVCRRCSALTDVYIPEGCSSIDNAAFYECKKLVNIDVTSVEVFGANSFHTCTSLKSVRFGEAVEKIGANSFYACESLSEIIFDGTPSAIASAFCYGTAWYNAKAAGLYTICDGQILMCKGIYSGTEVTVPEGVKLIADSIFSNNQNITSVTLPEGLVAIGSNAFSRADKLTGMYIPESVQYIGSSAVGYMTEGTSGSKVNPNFVITGKGHGTAYKYAASNGVGYLCLHEYEYVTKAEDCGFEIFNIKRCALCGIVTEKTGTGFTEEHSLEETVVNATCTEGGYTELRCKKCDYVEITEETEPTGHRSSEIWQITSEPTCTEYGSLSVLCLDCGTALEERLIEKKGHTPDKELRTVKEATCTEAGLSQRFCSTCGVTLEEITVSATGHTSQGRWTTVIPSENGSAGFEILLCDTCGVAFETRWFTFENGEKVYLENSEALYMCGRAVTEALTTTVSVSVCALDYNGDGDLDTKDSIAVKRLAQDTDCPQINFDMEEAE